MSVQINANSETGGGDLPDVSDVSDGENASAAGPIYDTSSDEEEERDELAALEEGAAVPHQRKANAETPDADDADDEEEDDEEEFSDPANTLEIQIVSDLHIEFYDRGRSPADFLIEPRAPILALLGDIGLACTDQLRAFLHSQSERFERVLFLAGNHEYYNRGKAKCSMDEQDAWMRAVCSERDNLHFMEKDSMVLNGVLVLATTLWSEIPDERLWEAEASMNDYALSYNHAEGEPPRRVTATETRQFHRESVAWLRARHADARRDGRKVLVLTHHTPVLSGTSHPQYDGSDLTCCFSSDLRGLLLCGGPPIVAWACGHTHYNFDFMVGNVRVLSNQRGYKGNPKRSYDRGGIVLKIHAKG